jgi:hypothetical protein
LSCSDRRLARAVVSLAALALLGAVAGCGADTADDAPASSAPADSAPAGMAADETTGRIAEVEFARQCTVATTSHAVEDGFTTDLDARLSAAGFTHEQWKQWHDALADSPALADQFAGISAAGCPAG